MVRKRRRDVVDLSSGDGSGEFESQDVQCSELPFSDYESFSIGSETELDSSSDDSSFDNALYQQCLKDFQKIKKMKRRFELAMSHKAKKKKSIKKTADGFTHFSASCFSKVISSLSSEYKEVLKRRGFGSLLLFNKCIVPNKFAQWVAHLVNPKSGDIICDGKVISFSDELVNQVLGIPVGITPFPADSTVGMAAVLSIFGKDKMPPVSFFADKLVKNEVTSEDMLIVCFLVVALNSFLCANTNNVPSPKYFGIFEDIEHIADYKWCTFVLDWLLDHIKRFNSGCNDKLKRCQGLGGCLYLLAVVYLDHIDFRQRKVADSIPRISVWKDDMIVFYSNLDLKTPGVYGYRPLMDYESTCYFKSVILKDNTFDGEVDVVFCEKMETACGCKLPLPLKMTICRLIKDYCFNSGLSLNLDLTSLRNVSQEFQHMFAKLMQHVSNIDSRSKKLVLHVMKAIAETNPGAQDVDYPPMPHGTLLNSCDPLSVSASAAVQSAPVGPSQVKVSPITSSDVPPVSAELITKSSAGMGTAVSPDKVAVRNPFKDVTNVVKSSSDRRYVPSSQRNVILIDLENECVPDSVSPSIYRKRTSILGVKLPQDPPNVSLSNKEEDVIRMQSLPLSDEEDGSPKIIPKVSSKVNLLSGFPSSMKKSRPSSSLEKDKSPVVCTGYRSFAQKLRDDTRKTDCLYNSQLVKEHKADQPPSYYPLNPEHDLPKSDFKCHDSSTGGKVPLHGSRRMV